MYAIRIMSPNLRERDAYGIPQTDNKPHVIADIIDSDGNVVLLDDLIKEQTLRQINETFTIFSDILKEIKKINLQLAFITDTLIGNHDVEV